MKTLSQTRAALGRPRMAMNVLRLASNVADGETVAFGAEVYEFDTAAAPGAVTSGNIRVDVSAAQTPAAASAALVAAINAQSRQGLRAVAISDNEVLIYGPVGGLDCTESLAGANNVLHTTTMFGQGTSDIKGRDLVSRAAISREVALGNLHFVFPFNPASVLVQVRTSAGVAKAWDGAITISGNRVTLDNTGSTDWAAGDVATVLAGE